MIQNGATVNSQAIDGKTPLFLAAEKGHLNIVEFLFRNNADLSLQAHSDDHFNRTALIVAAKNGKINKLFKIPEFG